MRGLERHDKHRKKEECMFGVCVREVQVRILVCKLFLLFHFHKKTQKRPVEVVTYSREDGRVLRSSVLCL